MSVFVILTEERKTIFNIARLIIFLMYPLTSDARMNLNPVEDGLLPFYWRRKASRGVDAGMCRAHTAVGTHL